MIVTVRQAAVPTARAIAWTPLLAVFACLIGMGGLIRALDAQAQPLLWIGVAVLSSMLVFGLRDPAAALLAPVPTSRLSRRLLRVAILAAVALPLWLVAAAVLPGVEGWALGPALALTATGVAVATWTPAGRDVGVAAAVPLAWAGLDQILRGSLGFVGDLAGWWRTESLLIAALAMLAVFFGRHR